MKRNPPILLLALALAGCGGHSGSSGNSTASGGTGVVNTSGDALVGTWTGSYAQKGDESDSDQQGTLTVTIARYTPAPGGEPGVGITGTVQDATRGAGTVSGAFVDPGAPDPSSFVFDFPKAVDDLYQGRLGVDATGHLLGTLPLVHGDAYIPTHFYLTRVTTAP